MITRFFKTSKPKHYFIFLVVMLAIYCYQRIQLAVELQEWEATLEVVSVLAFIGTLFLIVFIVTKNNLTQNNSYGLAYFCLFSLLVPEVFIGHYIIISNLFVLMAFRRIWSLRTQLNVKKKYYDAALWIGISAFFYPLALFYFIPLLLSVFIFQTDILKHFFVIVFGIATLFLLGISFHDLTGLNLPWQNWSLDLLGYDFHPYNTMPLSMTLILFGGLTLWTVFGLFSIKISKSKTRTSFLILLLMHFTGIIIPLLSTNKHPAELFFMIFPLSILLANVTEQSKSRWAVDLVISIILGFIVLKLFPNLIDIGFLY